MSQDHTNTSLNAEQAGLLLRFLERTSLQGGEAPVFVELCAALSTIARAGQAGPAAASVPAEDA